MIFDDAPDRLGALTELAIQAFVDVQVVSDDPEDLPIPGAGYGFSTLKHAQADGDLLTLAGRKRRAGRVHVDELVEVTR